MNGIKLVEDTITADELNELSEWIKTNPRLTKGDLTKEFENQWSAWQGSQKSIFVNSGSSANLLMAAALKYSGKLKNDKVVAPAVSWGTTVAPFMQLGFDVHLCDCENDTFGVDPNELEKLFKELNPAVLIIVHVLGVPNKMNEIVELCNKYDVLLVEDCCESHGAEFESTKVGNFGVMSSFSYYYGHHMSTIEGGMISFRDDAFYEESLMLRSHGWIRDLDEARQQELIDHHGVDEFNALYFFAYPGFNLRPTEINSFLGIKQLETLNEKIAVRNQIWSEYKDILEQEVMSQQQYQNCFVSPLAFGFVSNNRKKIVENLRNNNIECRPLICGSIHRHPFWKKSGEYKNANILHEQGMYVPVHHNMKKEDAQLVAKLILSS